MVFGMFEGLSSWMRMGIRLFGRDKGLVSGKWFWGAPCRH